MTAGPPGCSPAPTCWSTWRITAGPDLGERYLELGLRFGRLQPDLIDSYTGPAELRAQVAAAEPPSYAEIARDSATLLAEVDDRWLRAELVGLEAACRWFAGERVPFAELIRCTHQLEPELVPEEELAAAHARLGEALPGDGALHERYVAWRESQVVPAELVAPALDRLAAELRARTDALVGLPDGDEVDFVLETGKPWGGFADYQGDLRTRISINVDLPIPAYRLFELVTHEVYPGHHTDHVCKEPLIQQGRLELAIAVFPTPRSVVAEGIASLAHEALCGDEADLVGAEILEPLGIAYDAETSAIVRATHETLGCVGPNLVQMLAEGTIGRDEARPYARRWLLGPDELIDKGVALLNGPWPAYSLCYPAGRALARRFVAGDPNRFARLLREPLTPRELAA
jgi:hypothetical protein